MSTLDPVPLGIVTPLVTFITESGDPSAEAMTRHVNNQVDSGIHGLLAIGSTGELGSLTPDQRVRAIEIVVEAAAGRVPVWAGVAGLGTSETVVAARKAADAGAHALLVLQPLFLAASDSELERHFTTVAEASSVPIVVYDVPARSPRKIPASVMASLGEQGVIRGFKDSSGDLNAGRLSAAATAHINGFRAYMGSEITMDAAFLLGFHGIVPGFANVLPRHAVELFEAQQRGDRAAELAAQQSFLDLFRILEVPLAGAGGFTAAVNAIKVGTAHVLGLPTPLISEPLVQPSAEYCQSIIEIVDPLHSSVTARS
jgi:4-hydroxy-tetrahydrodipicolinate synthase